MLSYLCTRVSPALTLVPVSTSLLFRKAATFSPSSSSHESVLELALADLEAFIKCLKLFINRTHLIETHVGSSGFHSPFRHLYFDLNKKMKCFPHHAVNPRITGETIASGY